jgi:alkylhydroperoxidase family enzyme
MMRMAYWEIRRQSGKVISPVKIVIARMPKALKLTNEIAKFELKGIRLEPELHFMVGMLASQINGCSSCMDLGRAMVVRKHIGMGKFNAIGEYRTSPLFSDRERAALAYVEEATRNKHVDDATFKELRKHIEDWEIAEITWINAIENYYNLLNIALGIESDGLCAIAQSRQR